jgi:hypothetical protein
MIKENNFRKLSKKPESNDSGSVLTRQKDSSSFTQLLIINGFLSFTKRLRFHKASLKGENHEKTTLLLKKTSDLPNFSNSECCSRETRGTFTKTFVQPLLQHHSSRWLRTGNARATVNIKSLTNPHGTPDCAGQIVC